MLVANIKIEKPLKYQRRLGLVQHMVLIRSDIELTPVNCYSPWIKDQHPEIPLNQKVLLFFSHVTMSYTFVYMKKDQ